MERERHGLEILDVEKPSVAEPGRLAVVSVVVKNTGYKREDDVFVKVIVPELGIIQKEYVGILIVLMFITKQKKYR